MGKTSSKSTGRARSARGRNFILAGVVLMLASLAIWIGLNQQRAAIEVTGAPSLMVDPQVVDLGDVPVGEQVRVTYALTNVGDTALRFTTAPYVEVVEGC